MRRFLPSALLSATLLACAPPGPFPEAERAAVAATLADYRAAWLRNDADAVMAHVSEEFAMVVPGDGTPRVSGRTALRAFWFPTEGPTFRVTRYEVTGAAIHGGGQLAVAEGRSELAWDQLAGDSVVQSARSTSDFLTVLRKEEGQWRLYRQIYVLRPDAGP